MAELNIAIKKPPVSALASIAEIDKSSTSIVYSVVNVAAQSERFIDLTELIENEVGIQIRKFGAVGSYSTVVLRGASSQQVVVYLDGMAINTASIGAVDLSAIDIHDIERIEIYRGSTPIELGRASMGGAINIISKKNALKNNGRIKITQGSFSTQEYVLNQQQSSAKSRLLISANMLSSKNDYKTVFDNNTEFNLNDDRVIRVNNDDVEKKSASLRWFYEVDKSRLFDTRLQLYKKDKKIPNKNNNADVNTFFNTTNIDLLSQYNQQNLLSGNLDINLKLSLTHKLQVFDDTFEALGFVPQRLLFDNQNNRLQLLSKYQQSKYLWTLLTALGYETYQFKNELRAQDKSKNTRRDIEVNLQQTSHWFDDELIVNISIRYWKVQDSLDYAIDTFGDNIKQANQNYSITQPQIGLRYRLDSRSSLLFNAGRYTRVPLFSELFGNQGLFRGNEELMPETGINLDVGMRYFWFAPYQWYHDAEIYVGVFYNQADNLISRVYNSQGVSVAENIAGAEITGLEWDLKVKPNKYWRLIFNGSLMDSRAFSERSDANNKIIPGQYQQSYSLSSIYISAAWKFNLQQTLNKNIYWDSPNGRKGDDYYRVDVSISQKYLAHEISLKVNNLNNASYANFDHVWNRPGRSVFLSYQYSF